MWTSLLFLAAVHAKVAFALNWTATPFSPPDVPLAVRTPYLSAWLPQGSGTALNGVWPAFWNGNTLGWAGMVRVDGTVYSYLGQPSGEGATVEQASQKSLNFTATQSTFVMEAGPIDLTVSFLSPVEPTDLVKQSLPMSYMSVSAIATDGGSHAVQIYTDISGEWVSGDSSQTVNWTTSIGDVISHQIQLEEQTEFTEVNDRIQQGSVYYSHAKGSSTTYQTGQDAVVRGVFATNGALADSENTTFRAISNDWPVFAFAEDLGTVTSEETPSQVFSIAHIRDAAVEYIIADDQLQQRSLYYLSEYATPDDAISFFLGDYANAVSSANTFDSQIQSDASAISSDYASIVSLSVRQAFGATEVTISKSSDGSYNTSDVLVFMKEISSDGNVNTVDVIYPAWPIFLYTSPSYGRYLLEGLFQYQETGQYPNKYSVHDLGASYPVADGHNDGNDEQMPVEESGNMLIMSLSYAQAANDDTMISKYFGLLDQWTQFLIEDSLIPNNQISTDDFAGSLANQTNLAIKGIIGIKAMSVISGLVGDSSRESNYSDIASSYVSQWQSFATASSGDHLTLNYGNDSSWGLSYNILADKFLKTNLVPQSVYDMQTSWYTTVDNAFGVPLDTRHTYTKSDWQIWTAGMMTDTSVRDMFISAVAKYAADGESNSPLGDWYDSMSGSSESFKARPVVGGHLALLIL